MRKVEAFEDDAGKLHHDAASASKADEVHAYKARVEDFVRQSPLVYEAARDLEGWLLTDYGRACVLYLCGIKV